MGDFEVNIQGENGQSVGKRGFDMELDGMQDLVKRSYRKSKIDQIIEFYGIPYIYKNEYKKFLRYRIQPRHYQYITDYFRVILRSEGYDVTDFDYGKLQDEYNVQVPVAEHTGLDLHVNYQQFLENDKKHRDALLRTNAGEANEQIKTMQAMMLQMANEMSDLKKLIGKTTILDSKDITNEGATPSGSDSTTNAETNDTIRKSEVSEIDEETARSKPIEERSREGIEDEGNSRETVGAGDEGFGMNGFRSSI